MNKFKTGDLFRYKISVPAAINWGIILGEKNKNEIINAIEPGDQLPAYNIILITNNGKILSGIWNFESSITHMENK